MCFFVQTNHTRKELLFLMFKEINLRNHSSLHKLFYSLNKPVYSGLVDKTIVNIRENNYNYSEEQIIIETIKRLKSWGLECEKMK